MTGWEETYSCEGGGIVVVGERGSGSVQGEWGGKGKKCSRWRRKCCEDTLPLELVRWMEGVGVGGRGRGVREGAEGGRMEGRGVNGVGTGTGVGTGVGAGMGAGMGGREEVEEELTDIFIFVLDEEVEAVKLLEMMRGLSLIGSVGLECVPS